MLICLRGGEHKINLTHLFNFLQYYYYLKFMTALCPEAPVRIGIPLCLASHWRVHEFPPSTSSRKMPRPWVVARPNSCASICPEDREQGHGNKRHKWCRCIKPPHPTTHWQPSPINIPIFEESDCWVTWFSLLSTLIQASPLIYCCVFLLLFYK